jgi:hypothetical protein
MLYCISIQFFDPLAMPVFLPIDLEPLPLPDPERAAATRPDAGIFGGMHDEPVNLSQQ